MAPSKSKRARIAAGGTVVSQDKLHWKPVARPTQASFGALDQEGGVLELEEVEGVEVCYEELPGGGKKVVFKTIQPVDSSTENTDGGEVAVTEDMETDDIDDADSWNGIASDVETEAQSIPMVDKTQSKAEKEESSSKTDAPTLTVPGLEEKTPSAEDLKKKAKAEEKKKRIAKLKAEKREQNLLVLREQEKIDAKATEEKMDELFDDELLPSWSPFALHPHIKRSLLHLSYTSPTPIQAAALPKGLSQKDIVGVAETGSGKTLSYGLPILSYCLNTNRTELAVAEGGRRELKGLILAPTRELAIQVCQHLEQVLDPTKVDGNNKKKKGKPQPKGKGKGKQQQAEEDKQEEENEKEEEEAIKQGRKAPPRVSVGAITGGMAVQKQKRVWERGVDILVATPGRLWDLIGEDENLAEAVRKIRFLVIDEADRMIEAGHFEELESILALTHRSAAPASSSVPSSNTIPVPSSPGKKSRKNQKKGKKEEEEAPVVELVKDDFGEVEEDREDGQGGTREDLQTFVFSATLSKDLQRNLKKFQGRRRSKKGGSTLDDLFEKLDFRDTDPAIIDLSPEDGVVASLQESQINCLNEEKDLYLYYFLLRYPGRSLIFFGSVDGIRRAMPLFELLQLPVYPLHSQLQQKQRLRNLDRFKNSPDGILLATDIAARGLDIPSVDHVIHYQLPRTADTYVHRSGRTARAQREGFSLQLVGPEEKKLQKELMRSLKRDDEVPELPVEHSVLSQLKERIMVAVKIEKAMHIVKKKNHEKNWMREAAEAMDLELDSDQMPSEDDDEGVRRGVKNGKAKVSPKVAGLKAELRSILAEPLQVRGLSSRYITSGTRSVVDDLISGNQHEKMMGVAKTTASADAASGKSKKRKAVVLNSTE
ncbi:dead-domain-containing protein [Phaffia rhodozyma]|uniref:ATP-dependent RNA helicase n=1 Tax=Phaffia rhodozyma TaxID=264483 RepID=A0A0F7SUE1_PHARH|nr:dead-domain-containing protein [Phaffia rhodozyma]